MENFSGAESGKTARSEINSRRTTEFNEKDAYREDSRNKEHVMVTTFVTQVSSENLSAIKSFIARGGVTFVYTQRSIHELFTWIKEKCNINGFLLKDHRNIYYQHQDTSTQ